MRLAVALLALAILLAAAPAALALDVRARVEPSAGKVGETLLLTVEVSGALRGVGEPRLPDLGDAFQVRSAGTSRSFSIVNGRTSSSLSFRYALTPRKEGSFTIGAIEVEDGGSVARTAPIPVDITSAPAPAPPPNVTDERPGSTVGSRDVFVRATVDKETPYLFEQVTCRIALYNRVRLLEAPRLSGIATEGFWREELPGRPGTTTTINGETYQVWEIAYALFPTREGTLTIRDATLECEVQVRSGNRDPFSLFGGSLYESRTVPITAEPIAVRVRPLPAGAPPGFAGAVGDYVLEAVVDKTEVAQMGSVTLRVTVSGNGNLRTLGELPEPRLPDFRVYAQSGSEEAAPRNGVIQGTTKKEFVLVPLSAGTKVIPPIELATFSPRAGEYRVLKSRPITLTVTPAAAAAPGSAARGDIEVVGRDIRFIETDLPRFVRVGGAAAGAMRWLALLPLPFVGWGATALWAARRRRLHADVGLRRRSAAARAARRRLRAAARDGGGDRRAEAAAEALRGYVADRWNLPVAGLTAEEIAARVGSLGVDPGALTALLTRCDTVRFAPGAAGSDGIDPIAEAEAWIERLEKSR